MSKNLTLEDKDDFDQILPEIELQEPIGEGSQIVNVDPSAKGRGSHRKRSFKLGGLLHCRKVKAGFSVSYSSEPVKDDN